jgi:hypothetical protein
VYVNTLTSATNLATSLAGQGKNAEAKLQATLASCQRMLGPAHPTTLHTTRNLETVRARIRSTNAPTKPAAGTPQSLPTGTRVLVQRLIAKPEHTASARVCCHGRSTRAPAVCGGAGQREEAVAQGGVRGAGGLRGGGMRVGGGEQRVRAVQGGAVLLTQVPALAGRTRVRAVRSFKLKRRRCERRLLCRPQGTRPQTKQAATAGETARE